MLRAFLSLIFEWFSRFRAAEATVITFLFFSFLGGWLLSQTEQNRIVHAKQPIHAEVVISTNFTHGETIETAPRKTKCVKQ